MLPALTALTLPQDVAPPGPMTPPTPAPAGGPGAGGSFWDELKGAIQSSQAAQTGANLQIEQLVNGNSQDLHSTAIAVEKSDLAFNLMLQLRNKAVEAYQDIAHMAF